VDDAGRGVVAEQAQPSREAEGPAIGDLRRRFAFSSVIRALTRHLIAGLLGAMLMAAGLVWDAAIHARDPGAAHAEGSVLTLSRPAHALLVAGGALVLLGLTGATVRALSLSGSRRLSSPRTAVALVVAVVAAIVGTVGAVRWASTAQPPLATGPLAPAPNDAHAFGIVDSHARGPCRPTQAQKEAAAKLYNDTETGVARYRSLAAALADGYLGPTPFTSTEHFINASYTTDGKTVDPTRPEALMYTPTARGPVLVGVVYLMNVPGEFGPDIGGCLTRWHVHTNVCYNGYGLIVAQLTAEQPICPMGSVHLIPPPALHVWFVDVPGGRFAPDVDAEYLAKKVGP
jgi:hypothetical protein